MADSESVTKTGVGAKSTFGGTDFNWKNYERYRPTYPPALYEAIFAFHSAAAADLPLPSWETVYDFGCGPGTTFAHLLSRFSRVVGVDLNKPQLDAALVRFSEKAERSRVSVVEGKAEEIAERVEEGSVDLVVCAEAVHWLDAGRWLQGVGKMLKPGGTVAVIEYCKWPLDLVSFSLHQPRISSLR
jgi:SAM-dependent methyltransferase